MDAFEKARQKHAKNKARFDDWRSRQADPEATLPPAPVESVATVVPTAPVPEVPKERQDAIFQVKVSLPDREIQITLTKANVYGHVPRARMTEPEIKRAIMQGLSSLLGSVK